MVKRTVGLMLVFVAIASGSSLAADKTSFGLGVGALYNGLGGNLALIKADDMKYISVGCGEYMSSSIDGTYVTCGVGIGCLTFSFSEASTAAAGTLAWRLSSAGTQMAPILG